MTVYRAGGAAESALSAHKRGSRTANEARAAAQACIATAEPFVRAHPELKSVDRCPHAPKSCEAILESCRAMVATLDQSAAEDAARPSDAAIQQLHSASKLCRDLPADHETAAFEQRVVEFHAAWDSAAKIDPKARNWNGKIMGRPAQTVKTDCEAAFVAWREETQRRSAKREALIAARKAEERKMNFAKPAPARGKLHSTSVLKVLGGPANSARPDFKVAALKVVVTGDDWSYFRHDVTNAITARAADVSVLARDPKGTCWRLDTYYLQEKVGGKFQKPSWANNADSYYEYDCAKSFGKQ